MEWVDVLYESVLHDEFGCDETALQKMVQQKLNSRTDASLVSDSRLRPCRWLIHSPKVKPLADDEDVIIMPIPEVPYSLRIWPGSRIKEEYCIDFVVKDTSICVDTPKGFEIWTAPPKWTRLPQLRLGEFNRLVWTKEDGDVPPEGNGFLVPEGLTGLLKRDGALVFNFSIPTRPPIHPRPKRCAAGICRSGDDSSPYEALDLDTKKYYALMSPVP